MRLEKADPARMDFKWAEPLIGDIVTTGYQRIGLEQRVAGALARLHLVLWCQMVSDDEKASASRTDLVRVCKRYAVGEAQIEEINQDVLVELMHVISRRFQRSPERTRACSMEMVRVACWLTQKRLATAG